MPNISFYFQVHQPYRLRHYNFFEIGESPFYEDIDANRSIISKIANKCYLPMNSLLLKLINKYKGKFKVAFSITGNALDQFTAYAPEVLASFQELVKTGSVELLTETDNHSLAFLYSKKEFKRQVALHDEKIGKFFGVKPKVFRNTELVYNNDLAVAASELGYEAVLLEGADHILGWRSPNYVYSPVGAKTKLLLRNYQLSDDIAFRFSNKSWGEYPLTADKFANWVVNSDGDVVNLYMDYETFGEHQWADSGIFEFIEALPAALFAKKGISFLTPSEVVKKFKPVAELNVTNSMSWADVERDLTAWMGNDMQRDALETVYRLEEGVLKTDNPEIYKIWGRLQTSDHFYYMCTKWFSDGEVHKYFNPYGTPYDAYINYMNVMGDFELRIKANLEGKSAKFATPVSVLLEEEEELAAPVKRTKALAAKKEVKNTVVKAAKSPVKTETAKTSAKAAPAKAATKTTAGKAVEPRAPAKSAPAKAAKKETVPPKRTTVKR
ncbi:MAG: glycoside hydrolase family 57 protein [Deferribacteraceae bacterium]|jgi:alpha-amylase|nr:glycoside hydrolase family 57 protein [Deferribacteraceae bacterium]